MHALRPFAAVAAAGLLAYAPLLAQTRAATDPAARAAIAVGGREQTATEQALHVLSRLSFGPRPGDAEKVRAIGVDRWIAAQLAPERLADAATDALVARYETLHEEPGALARDFAALRRARNAAQREATREGDTSSRREMRRETLRENPELRQVQQRIQRSNAQLQSAKLARAVSSERQLQELMVDFWENHFSVFAGKGATRYYLAEYDRDVIRPRAFGKFRDLLGAVAKSPAMLFYLDNWQSRADSTQPTLAGGGVGPAGRGAGGNALRQALEKAMRADGTIDESLLPATLRRRWERMPADQKQRLQNGLRQVAQRRPRGLNENYARELLELHTVGVDGGYTQKDVIEVARALTGWTMAPNEGSGFVFRPEMHDAGEKIVLGQRLKAGRGIEDGEQVLDIVARHPATSRFIARKLVIRFVSDTPPAALVERAAKVFRETDGDIRETLRTIVTSPEFFSRAAYRSKVKTPFEVVASALRAVGATPDTTPRSAQQVARLGQPIFGRQTPDGWPDRADAWMNTGAILNRINFGLTVASGQLPGASLARWPSHAKLKDAPRAQQVDGVISSMLGGDVSPLTREVLMNGENPLLSRLASDSNAVAGAAAQMRDPDPPDEAEMMDAQRRPERPAGGGRQQRIVGALGRPARLDGIAQIVGLALGSPEFQRR
jgi:uncharacterized protein (DUF1800 family)